ncbi:hypothetical protein AAT19DRAFT_15338 [Rhodotorula toruloides]|uniref:Uncharacterized protein n=1 Tax=Rhodotorula toruloides TaxID=5286 RepID=A0A2T0A6X0_RHOTO|nr:hypothetical protein AAT19DRAFT_15338 [Rhodotorula toruloides]
MEDHEPYEPADAILASPPLPREPPEKRAETSAAGGTGGVEVELAAGAGVAGAVDAGDGSGFGVVVADAGACSRTEFRRWRAVFSFSRFEATSSSAPPPASDPACRSRVPSPPRTTAILRPPVHTSSCRGCRWPGRASASLRLLRRGRRPSRRRRGGRQSRSPPSPSAQRESRGSKERGREGWQARPFGDGRERGTMRRSGGSVDAEGAGGTRRCAGVGSVSV